MPLFFSFLVTPQGVYVKEIEREHCQLYIPPHTSSSRPRFWESCRFRIRSCWTLVDIPFHFPCDALLGCKRSCCDYTHLAMIRRTRYICAFTVSEHGPDKIITTPVRMTSVTIFFFFFFLLGILLHMHLWLFALIFSSFAILGIVSAKSIASCAL